ncbi:hypothetical protein V475_18315 [Sphingobium baderi LL03]|uniref:Uncharacterized protein n=1 Tax=Sphingobium baderi LL03 TaxID=1114964 RepID=T0GNZ3_9SPHN|nr:hypothetical protein L485_07800 [Sphingobium baderi LL03]KMS60734.1 hypothetical protein V475_18315 [Sphingobium baderi LL03]
MFLSPYYEMHRPLRRDDGRAKNVKAGGRKQTCPASGTASLSIRVARIRQSNRAENRIVRSYRA